MPTSVLASLSFAASTHELLGAGLPTTRWPYQESLIRLALGLSLGLLIGLERERRGKEAGLRTFGFVALLGAVGGLLGDSFALMALGLTGLLVVFLNIQTLRIDQSTELTTSAALLLTCAGGILCGVGHKLTPAGMMVIVTALSAWKRPLAGFTMGLTEGEIRSALLLAILAIVIYPALPEGAVGPWDLIEPRAAWVTVILIAAIGFVNYVLWKLYGDKGIELTGFLGGLVNSSVTVNELAMRVGAVRDGVVNSAYRGILLATVAMLLRNAFLLALLAPPVLATSALSYLLMLGACAVLYLSAGRVVLRVSPPDAQPMQLELPFSLWVALKYGFLFVVLQVAGLLAQRWLGEYGFYVVSLCGGVVSSASSVAAAASLAAKGSLTAQVAGTGAVIASLTSVMINFPLVWKARSRRLTTRLGFAMFAVLVAGMAGTMMQATFIAGLIERWSATL